MRIALIIYGDLLQQSGGYLYDRRLVEALRALGARVDVFSQINGRYGRRLAANLDLRLLRRVADYDVVLEDEWNHPSLVVLNAALRALGGPPIVPIVHNLSSDRPGPVPRAHAIVERRYLRGVDALIYNSEHTKARVIDFADPAAPGTVALPGGDHLGQAPPVASADGAVRLLFVGHLSPLKGLEYLLDALNGLQTRAPWRLDVVGALDRAPEYVASVRAMIRRFGLSRRVQLCGAIPPAEMPERYADADLFVLTSPAEGFGIAYLEAMRAGLPVIASSLGAAPTLIEAGEEGFLVDPTDAAALRGRLAQLIDDGDMRARLGAAALRRADRHPSWSESAETVMHFLGDVVRQAGSRKRPGIRAQPARPGRPAP